MKKLFTLNLWTASKSQGSGSAAKESAVIDGVDGDSAGKTFGVRSYLHQFYLSPSGLEDIEPGASGAWYLLPPPPSQRMGLYICRLFTIFGLLLLIGGASAIIVGYCWPHASSSTIEANLIRIAIDQDEEGNFYIPPKRLAELLRDPMHAWKIIGFCAFALGASLMALSLLIPTCAQCIGGSRLAAFASGDNTPNEPPVRIYPSAGSKFGVMPTKMSGGHKISPTSGPVPVMEEISKVQPKQGAKANKKQSPSPSPTADELLNGDAHFEKDSQPLL